MRSSDNTINYLNDKLSRKATQLGFYMRRAAQQDGSWFTMFNVTIDLERMKATLNSSFLVNWNEADSWATSGIYEVNSCRPTESIARFCPNLRDTYKEDKKTFNVGWKNLCIDEETGVGVFLFLYDKFDGWQNDPLETGVQLVRLPFTTMVKLIYEGLDELRMRNMVPADADLFGIKGAKKYLTIRQDNSTDFISDLTRATKTITNQEESMLVFGDEEEVENSRRLQRLSVLNTPTQVGYGNRNAGINVNRKELANRAELRYFHMPDALYDLEKVNWPGTITLEDSTVWVKDLTESLERTEAEGYDTREAWVLNSFIRFNDACHAVYFTDTQTLIKLVRETNGQFLEDNKQSASYYESPIEWNRRTLVDNRKASKHMLMTLSYTDFIENIDKFTRCFESLDLAKQKVYYREFAKGHRENWMYAEHTFQLTLDLNVQPDRHEPEALLLGTAHNLRVLFTFKYKRQTATDSLTNTRVYLLDTMQASIFGYTYDYQKNEEGNMNMYGVLCEGQGRPSVLKKELQKAAKALLEGKNQ